MTKTCFLIFSITFFFLFCGWNKSVLAQGQNEEQEVFLQLRYQNVVNTYISSIYNGNDFYLSLNDLFNSLNVDLNTDHGSMVVKGNYIGKGRYSIDLNNRKTSFQGKELTLSADDFIISDMGYYLKPEVLEKLFSLEFTIDFNNLSVRLETNDTMPVLAQKERERRRERLNRTRKELNRNFAPLQFDRDPSFFNAGFLDYNLTTNFNETGSGQFLYSTNIGTELLGGDLQGAVFGSYSQTSSSLRSSGLRWRYGIRDTPWISTISVGQTGSGGISPVALTGLKITNEPIEPRYLYGETAFTGSGQPNSEVELYRNNTLVDFTETDESGTYRFTVPITYGSSQYNVRIYNRDGRVTQRDARMQIPFHFLPPGDITYNVEAGKLDNPLSGSTSRGLVSKANLTAGLTNWLTASGGAEYFEDFHDELPTFSGKLSSRFFTNYLISLEAANNAFYRASASVIYPSNASLNIDYTYFNQPGGLYNPGRNESSLRANLFTPLQLGSLPLFFRWSFNHDQRESGSVYRYRADLNTRIGKANIRFGYRDTQIGTLSLTTTPVSRLNFSAGYSFGRSRQTAAMLRGLFLRSQMNYIPAVSQVENAELQLSRNIFKSGRLHLSAGHNFIGNFNMLRFSLTFDFSRFRSNSSVRNIRKSSTFTQSIRGSAGFDSNHGKILLSNRQQAGRSGLAVRLFMDQNNNGQHDPDDELIPENAIRLDRSGGNTISKDGITYISQLQPYRRYNLSVKKNALNNPLLVPEFQEFSVITDPNQYKLIEIPFYTTGVAEGKVNRIVEGEKRGLGGIRLFLNQVNIPEGTDGYSEEIRTFSDGSFYTYEIPPGDYQIQADPSQLDFLNVHPDPARLEFSIRALAEGDFAENLELNLVPDEDSVQPEQESVPEAIGAFQAPSTPNTFSMQFDIPVDTVDPDCRYSIQTGSFSTLGNAFRAVELFNNSTGFEYEIFLNREKRLYSVRTKRKTGFSQAVERAGFIQDRIQNDLVAVVSQCGEADLSGGPLVYQIQLASFSNELNAKKFQEQLEKEYALETFILVESESLYRVRTGPYKSSTALQEAFSSITDRGISRDAFITYDPESLWDRRFDYKLQLGRFSNDEQAALYSLKIRSDYDIPTMLLMDEEYLNVMTENEYDNWDQLIQDYYEIIENPRNQKPVIHLKER